MPRQRFPRQSAASSSGGAATSSSSDATTPGTTTSDGLDTTTAGLATATGLTSGLSSSLTSGTPKSLTPSSASAGLTTTSSSTGTTSTSQSTSSSQSSSHSSPSTSSLAPTSSSSIPPSTTSSTASPSISVPPTTTTQPSSSQQGTSTIITSSYTTYVNGSLIATQTSYPSTIPALLAPSSSNNRAAIIGGSAAGGTAVLILLLTLAFCARRKRFKRLHFLDAITLKRKQIRSRATLLDGEDLAGVDLQQPPRRYTDYETPWDTRASRDGSDRALLAGSGTPGTPHTYMGPSRSSEIGSAFKEDVWPTPHEGTRLMDPFTNRDDLDLDLGRIVDDVMGPSPTAVHFSDRSVSSMYRDSVAGSEGEVHSRTVSNASNAGLLEAAGLAGTLGSLSTAPVRSSPLAQPETKPGSVEDRGNAS